MHGPRASAGAPFPACRCTNELCSLRTAFLLLRLCHYYCPPCMLCDSRPLPIPTSTTPCASLSLVTSGNARQGQLLRPLVDEAAGRSERPADHPMHLHLNIPSVHHFLCSLRAPWHPCGSITSGCALGNLLVGWRHAADVPTGKRALQAWAHRIMRCRAGRMLGALGAVLGALGAVLGALCARWSGSFAAGSCPQPGAAWRSAWRSGC